MSNPTELPYTDADILELVGLVQRMREIKHWEMQAGSKILAEIVGRMHAGLIGRAQPEGEAPQAEKGELRSALMAVDGQLCAILNGADESVYSKLKAARNDLVRIWLPMGGPAAQHADTGAQAGVKPWEERIAEWRAANSIGVVPEKKMMRAEIAELRAALAAQSQGARAAPDEAAIIALAKAHGFTFTRPMGSPHRVELFAGNAEHHERFIGFAQAVAAQQAAAPAEDANG